MTSCDVLIVGGGAAGMSAALELRKREPTLDVLMIDRGAAPGGVLLQCVHRGFGQGYFGEELTGVEYAGRLKELLRPCTPALRLETEAVSVHSDRTALLAGPGGWEMVGFRRLILATGCLERGIGSLRVGGSRPSGVYTAGQVQQMMNLGGYDPGERAVILGSGDVGLIMARQLKQQGKQVLRIVEQKPESPALERNLRQCVEESSIPLQFRATVSRLHGGARLEGVTVQSLAGGTEEYLACDLLVTALGLIPDQRLCEGLGTPDWLYLFGNCAHVHPIVDAISLQAPRLAEAVLESLGG